MSFFDEFPEPEFEVGARRRQPEWAGPPDNVLAATVPLDLVLANTGELAVVLGRVRAYPTGVLFDVTILRRTLGDNEERPFGIRFHRGGPGSFRLGVELPDGLRLGAHVGGDPERARLSPQGGGGSDLRYTTEYWLWPLPGEGTMHVACEWRDEGLDEAVRELDTVPILEAAGRAVELWPDDRPIGDDDEW
jgi:hypothetical protein